MDATIFLRFVRMCRNMFLVLSFIGICVLIPVNMTNYDQDLTDDKTEWFSKITPQFVFGKAQWALVVVAWISNIVIAAFLWWNYRKVMELRRAYFETEEYQNSLHARTLMVRNTRCLPGLTSLTLRD